MCNSCETNYYNSYDSTQNQPEKNPTCELCSCDADGSLGSDCQDGNGQCTCKNDKINGRTCNTCEAGYIGTICDQCDALFYIDPQSTSDCIRKSVQ